MANDADVLIIGAGPAGGSAAFFLQQLGFKVLIVDKAALPRYKPCGGGVPLKVLKSFSFDTQSIIEDFISNITFAYQHEHINIPVKPETLAMTMRNKLDLLIIENSKAEILENTKINSLTQDNHKVVISTDKGLKLQGKYLIAADGANSKIAQILGLGTNRQMGVALELEAEVRKKTLDDYRSRMLIGTGNLPWGYYWIFPKADHLSIGIGTFKKKIQGILNLFKKNLRDLEINFSDQQIKAHPLPYFNGRQTLAKNRVLLCGDAARLVDPLTGEGIQYAIRSGKIAAEVIANQDIATYNQQIEEKITNNFKWAKLLAYIMYNYTPACFHYLIRNNDFISDLFQIFTRNQEYKYVLAKLPMYFTFSGKRIELNK